MAGASFVGLPLRYLRPVRCRAHKGGNPPMSDEARAAMLADERVVMGPRRRGGR